MSCARACACPNRPCIVCATLPPRDTVGSCSRSGAPAHGPPHCHAATRAPRGRWGQVEDAPDTQGSDEGGSISVAQILSLKERFDRADTDGGGSLDLQEFMDAFGSILNKNGEKSGLLDCYCLCAPHHPTLRPIPATSPVASDNSVRSLIQMSRLSASLCRSTPTPTAASTGKTPTRRCADAEPCFDGGPYVVCHCAGMNSAHTCSWRASQAAL